MKTPIRLYNPQGPDLVAVISTEPVFGQPGAFMVKVARGKRSTKLSNVAMFGPFTADVLAARVDEVADTLRAEGFGRSGLAAMLQELHSGKPKVRAHAALRLGWRREKAAVDPLLGLIPNAGDDLCSIVDALGAVGDAKAVPAVRVEAEKKLLSRRRSGVEALRNLGDVSGITDARNRALERLPLTVREVLSKLPDDNPSDANVETVRAAVMAADEKDRGLAADTLYEMGTPLSVAAARAVLSYLPLDAPFTWRYAKSVFKRAMLRHDPVMFGWLAHAIERAARKSKGTKAVVKSGYDGQSLQTSIFNRSTQDYMRRLAWRYLRRLAEHRSELYPIAAAEALIHYTPDDGQNPKGPYGVYAGCYLLMQIAFGGSKRFKLQSRSLKFKVVKSGATKATGGEREERYPELWDAQPRAFIRVLARSQIEGVQMFAERAVRLRHLDALQHAAPEELVAMVSAPYEPTVRLALTELRRRFNPNAPDFPLLRALLVDGRPLVRELGLDWLSQTAHLWTRDAEQSAAFLSAGDPGVKEAVARWITTALASADAGRRRTLAEKLLHVIRQPEPTEGAWATHAELLRGVLADELVALMTMEEVTALLAGGSVSAQAVAAAALARRPDALQLLGLPRIVELATHERASVRAGAHAILRGALLPLKQDPSALFQLAESEWKDTRAIAVELLRQVIDPSALGLDGIMGLCDSMRVEVQELGRELAIKNLETLDVHELMVRLSQHPHPNMRRFALELVVTHLRDGFTRLARLEEFFRMALLDVWPDRRVKRTVIDFLARRGQQDGQQAELAARLLGELVRSKTAQDSERALQALVRIKLAFPETEAPVQVLEVAAP